VDGFSTSAYIIIKTYLGTARAISVWLCSKRLAEIGCWRLYFVIDCMWKLCLNRWSRSIKTSQGISAVGKTRFGVGRGKIVAPFQPQPRTRLEVASPDANKPQPRLFVRRDYLSYCLHNYLRFVSWTYPTPIPYAPRPETSRPHKCQLRTQAASLKSSIRWKDEAEMHFLFQIKGFAGSEETHQSRLVNPVLHINLVQASPARAIYLGGFLHIFQGCQLLIPSISISSVIKQGSPMKSLTAVYTSKYCLSTSFQP